MPKLIWWECFSKILQGTVTASLIFPNNADENFGRHVQELNEKDREGQNESVQLTLGIDRDSAIMSQLFSEKDEAAKIMISMMIEKAKKAGSKIGLCGQAPSDDPEFAQFLVRQGIYSISFNPGASIKGIENIKLAEEKMKPREEEEILNF